MIRSAGSVRSSGRPRSMLSDSVTLAPRREAMVDAAASSPSSRPITSRRIEPPRLIWVPAPDRIRARRAHGGRPRRNWFARSPTSAPTAADPPLRGHAARIARRVVTGGLTGPLHKIGKDVSRRAPPAGSGSRIARSTQRLLTVVLDAGGAQAREAVLVDGLLPAQEFFGRQRVALARFLETEEAAPDRGDDFRLAADHPATGVGGGKVRNRQRAAVWPDDIFDPR